MGAEVVEHVPRMDGTGILCPLDHSGCDRRLYGAEARLLADGGGTGAAELDAVVLGGVVTGGEHRPGSVEPARREVDEVGGCQADVDDVGSCQHSTLGERRGEWLRRRAHVAADDDRGCTREPGERVPEATRHGLVDLVGVDAPDVVCLEDRVERHCCFLVYRGRSDSAGTCRSGSTETAPTPRQSERDGPSRRFAAHRAHSW